jgi:hypothetical protein
MKKLIFGSFTFVVLISSCNDFKKKSYFPCSCNEHYKYLMRELYIYPIGAHKIYLIDSLNNMYYFFDYDETANSFNEFCNNDTIVFIKTEYEKINDSIRRYNEVEKVLFVPSKKEIIRDFSNLSFHDDTMTQSW